MVKILFELDEEEDKIAKLIKAIYKLEDKQQAIKKIIREYGKKIEVEDRNIK